jgi:hypothetical protein
MRSWLARLSFSLFIFGFLLGWEAYKALRGELGQLPAWRIAVFLLGSACCFALGFIGVRERHRPDDQ